MKIAFVTDSTAYIPADLVRKYEITVTPQILIWGDQTFQDGVDIQPVEFYNRLKTAKVMPSTSQVSVVTMQKTFQELVDKGLDVLGVFISAKLSGTMQSAIQGREALGSAAGKVTIVDSNSTAMAMGFQVLSAARAAEQGAGMADCKQLVEKGRDHVGVYFAVDTLEFLHRGGRIGGAQRFIGSALNLKPILALKDGRVEAEDRVRTKSKALDRLLELVEGQVRGQSNIRLATLHANAEQEARELLERASRELHAIESVLSSVSPVVGAHAGPGTVGLAFMAGM
jgi:DegV family protein with EDD domain